MTSLTLRLRQPLSQRIDMSPFTLQGLAGKALDDIARIPLWLGNRQVDTGELFAIDGEVGDEIRIQSDSERQGMRGGTLLVKGDAGERAGDLLRRGTVLIGGDRGDYCASRMVAGTMVVLGHTGIQTGLAMRRGTLIVTR
ncbi:MAG: hypothetical protein PVF13_01785 [Chromatiales bacterium]